MKFWLADLRDRDLVWVTNVAHDSCGMLCDMLCSIPNSILEVAASTSKLQVPGTQPNPTHILWDFTSSPSRNFTTHHIFLPIDRVQSRLRSEVNQSLVALKKKLTCKVCSPLYHQIFLFLIRAAHHAWISTNWHHKTWGELQIAAPNFILWKVQLKHHLAPRVTTCSNQQLRGFKGLSFDPPRIVRVSPENIIHSKNGSKCSRWKWKSIGNYYCWWKKSCTTSNLKNPVNSGINYQPQLVGKRRISEPSTVSDPLPFLRKGLSFSSALVHIRRDNIRLLSCRFSDLWIYSRPKCNLVWNSNKGKTWKNWKLTYPIPAGTFEDDFPFPRVGYVTSLNGNQHLGVQSRRSLWQPRRWMRTCMTFTGSSTSTRAVLNHLQNNF